MKKTENKSILPKLIVILLIVMLISTSLLSRTLAKYVTSGTLLNDTARVAKWGVVITPADNALFSTTYAADETGYTAGNTVASINTDLVVAPGTKGTSVDFTVTGQPEVATRVQLVDNGSAISGWTVANDAAYEPVKWTLKQGSSTILDGGSFADLLSHLGTSSELDFAPNTDLSNADNGFVIEWEWPFDSDDVNDTYLGDKATPPTITLNLDITITQID